MARSDKTTDSSSARYLIYLVTILGSAGLMVSLLRVLLPLLQVLLPVGVGWWIWRRYQITQKTQTTTLNSIFYQLLQEHQGRITVLDFAIAARLSASSAREFLDLRAKEFAAHFEVTEQGDVFYLFPLSQSPLFQTATAVPTTVTATTVAPAQTVSLKHTGNDDHPGACTHHSPLLEPLTQAQLARRLGVSAGAISRKKLLPELVEWTKSRDPDGIGWAYLAQSRRFLPLI